MDIAPKGPGIIQHDLSRGIPLPDTSCDVVYHAAVLEHLRRPDVAAFLTECYRVLKPGGVVRVGVPDLEKICRLYLSRLTKALNGDKAAVQDYDWILLELYDQTVRETSGGGMRDFLRQIPLPNAEFVYGRIGEEGRQLVEVLRIKDNEQLETSQNTASGPSIFRWMLKRVRSLPVAASQRALRFLIGSEGMRALAIGRFRLAGEVHHWMYDRFSLARLLCSIGFLDPQVKDANTSRVPDWNRFNLDTLPDGTPIKPDLFFMEAIKPGISTNE